MNRRRFLESSGVLAAAGLVGGGQPEADTIGEPRETKVIALPNITIREYLCREARRITDRALSEYRSAADWRRLIPKKRKQFAEMMGLPAGDRPAVPVHVTGTVGGPAY